MIPHRVKVLPQIRSKPLYTTYVGVACCGCVVARAFGGCIRDVRVREGSVQDDSVPDETASAQARDECG